MEIWVKIEKFFLNLARKIKLGMLADLYESHLEGMRYLVFGALTTVINIATYSIFFYLCNVSNAISNVIAWIVGVIFAYVTNKIIVFESKADSKQGLLKEISSFVVCRFLTLIVDEIIMIITVDKLGFNGLLMKIIANIVVIILNFIFSKLIIFKKGKKE